DRILLAPGHEILKPAQDEAAPHLIRQADCCQLRLLPALRRCVWSLSSDQRPPHRSCSAASPRPAARRRPVERPYPPQINQRDQQHPDEYQDFNIT
ncbi:MAG TPA: hypothetical protein VKT25_13125, partial [Ktedonobacteraceae bacterium]|nr:hypothetical protein [Ktedonobacteraceae bacterium]